MSTLPFEFRVVRSETARAARVDPDVFDGPIRSEWLAAFLAQPWHRLVVAVVATGSVELEPPGLRSAPLESLTGATLTSPCGASYT